MLSRDLQRKVMEYYLEIGTFWIHERLDREELYLRFLELYNEKNDMIYGITDTTMMISFSRLVGHILERFSYTLLSDMRQILSFLEKKKPSLSPWITIPLYKTDRDTIEETESFSIFFEEGEIHSTSIAYSLVQSSI